MIEELIGLRKNNVYPYLNSKCIPSPEITFKIVKVLLRPTYHGTNIVRNLFKQVVIQVQRDVKVFLDWEEFMEIHSGDTESVCPCSQPDIHRSRGLDLDV